MNPAFVAFEPYRPHLAYTFVITVICWVSVTAYGRSCLRYRPAQRVALYGLALALPIYAETSTYLLTTSRPWLDSVTGHVLLREHTAVLQVIPLDDCLDSVLSQTVTTIGLVTLSILMFGSLLRFGYGSILLRRRLKGARLLSQTAHASLAAQLASEATTLQRSLPAIQLLPLAAPLAFTTGLFRPRIYVTTTLLDVLTPDEALAVLCHEWAHVLRHDNFWNWLMCLLRDMTCFLPGSQQMWRAMLVSQDEACDAIAARMTRKPLALAHALIKAAEARQYSAFRSAIPLTANLIDFRNNSVRQRVEAMVQLSDTGFTPELQSAGPRMFGATMVFIAILPVLLGC